MAILTFTLSEDGVLVFHDALACVSKFSEDVCLEARKDRLSLTALHMAKSAYASFNFTASRFFSRFEFTGSPQSRDRFFCSLYIRSLLSVFRTRLGGDPSRESHRETTIDRCEVTIEDETPGVKSRLVAKIVSRNGITATHALPFEPKPPVHAKFDKTEAANHWSISSRTLRQLMDHFGRGIELLDINTEDENVVNFCCFNEKVAKINNEELLKKPLRTSIAVDKEEFDDIVVQDDVHIIVNVKDFRAILQHAQATSGELSACYSNPGRPMKLFYSADGIMCEFVLMTVGDRTNLVQKLRKGTGKAKATGAVKGGLEPASTRSGSVANGSTSGTNEPSAPAQPEAPPKPAPKPALPHFEIRPPPLPPISTLQSDSLFVLQPDEDQEWEPQNQDDEDDMGETTRLEWDTSGQPSSTMRISSHQADDAAQPVEVPDLSPAGLEPTQRLAEVRKYGLFSS